MPEIYMVAAAILTSVAAYAIALRRWHGTASLRLALRRTLECAGLGLVFFAVNLLTEAGLVLLARALTGRFVALYLAGDLMILPISCLQALAVWWWRELARRAARDVSSRALPL
jgi:hypothetical protein